MIDQVYYEVEDILYFRQKLVDLEMSLLFDEDASNILVADIIKEFDKHFNINQ